jgi:DNA-binding transcriptional LysR family regulator
MNKTQVVLENTPLLLALAESGSATRAAQTLGITTATALRRLETVEAALSTQLFDRHSNGLRPRPALELVTPWAEQAASAATGMLREVTGAESHPVGAVRLALPPAIGTLFVVPELGSLRAQYPDLTLEIAPASAIVNLTTREADLAIRAVKPESGDLVAQKLVDYRISVFKAPDFKLPPAFLPQDLPWLGFDANLARSPESRWLAQYVPDARFVMRSSDLVTLLVAAQRGLGVLAASEPAVEKVGGLVPFELPVDTKDGPQGSLWLVAHQALRRVARVNAVWDWTMTCFQSARNTNLDSQHVKYNNKALASAVKKAPKRSQKS